MLRTLACVGIGLQAEEHNYGQGKAVVKRRDGRRLMLNVSRALRLDVIFCDGWMDGVCLRSCLCLFGMMWLHTLLDRSCMHPFERLGNLCRRLHRAALDKWHTCWCQSSAVERVPAGLRSIG